MFNPRIPVTINGKPCILAFDMAAVATLEEKYGVTIGDLAAMQKKKKPEQKSDLTLAMKLLYAMTRSMDDPPTEKDIQRMSMPEVLMIEPALKRAMLASTATLGESKAVGQTPSAASASRGNGGARSPRRSIVLKSRRRNSGR